MECFMSLNPQISDLLTHLKGGQIKPFHQQSVLDLRKMAELMSHRDNPEEIFRMTCITIPGEVPLSARIYRPKERGPLPTILFFHGGGWVAGSLNTADSLCRSLANRTGCQVISVDYRLAPEHPFPAATDDAYHALQWVFQEARSLDADLSRIMVAGDSAGANIAAALALMARDRKGPKIASQMLFYPILNARFDTPSYKEFGKGFYFEKEDLAWCWDQYVPNSADRKQPYASPAEATDLSGLPPAIIITAECDVLRDEAEHYAQKLREADNVVLFKRFPGMIHGFLIWQETIDAAKKAVIEICDGVHVILAMLKEREAYPV
jgi:acetyl esterase